MNAAAIGQIGLGIALVGALAALGSTVLGLVRQRPAWLRWGRSLVLAAFGGATVASAALVFLLVTDDFSVRYVAERSASAMPLIYKIGAWWGGQEGSLLFWLWLLLGYAALVVTARPDLESPRLWPPATAVMAGVAAYFAWLVAFLENPFRLLAEVPADGMGLNPLLQSPSMLVHPVTLYLGWVGMTVPFAFAVAALATGLHRSDAWVRVARHWIKVPWMFLGLGIVLGGEWAYKELGWGGYWGWDPVENASLVPWLLATAFVHSGLASERRGTLRRWNAVLVPATFVTVMLGTFVTRSGVLASVHAFAESPTGPYFLGFIGLVVALSVYLLMLRWASLEDARPIPSALSREGAFVAGNLILASLAFAVAFGTAVPIVSRAFGPGITVQAPYFEKVSAPLFAAMLVAMGLGMALPWQASGGAGAPGWVRRLLPVVAGTVLFAVLLAAGGAGRPTLVAGMSAAFLAGGAALAEVVREARLRLRRHRPGATAPGHSGQVVVRRLGGIVSHAGLAIVAVAVVASTAFQVRTSRSLQEGQSATLAGYTLRFGGLAMRRVPGATEVFARLDLHRGNAVVATLQPAKRVYDGTMAEYGATSEVAVYRRAEGDVYVALAGWDESGRVAAFEIFVNPLVNWLWVGALLMLVGTGLSAIPARRSAQAIEREERALLEQAAGGAVSRQRGQGPARAAQPSAAPR